MNFVTLDNKYRLSLCGKLAASAYIREPHRPQCMSFRPGYVYLIRTQRPNHDHTDLIIRITNKNTSVNVSEKDP